MEVARAGSVADPPIEAPRPLRPLLRFRRLSSSALDIVRRAVDEDAALRSRVAAAAEGGVEGLDRAGQLFLLRPEGWRDELRRLEDGAAAEGRAVADEAEERSARRRLRLVEEAAQRADERVGSLRAELAAVRAELAEERRLRSQAQEEASAATNRIPGLERERSAAHRRAAASETEVARLRQEVGEVRAQLAAAATVVTEPTAPVPTVASPVVEPAAEPTAPAVPFDVVAVRAAVADAGRAAAELGRSLEAVARAFVDDSERSAGARTQDIPVRPPTAAPAPASTGRMTGRLPVALPPGRFEDDPAVADHLVRVRGCVLVVDGYNASLRRWPELPIAEQRRRLVDASAGLAARCGAEVHIVFDGVDENAQRRGLARRNVRITFSPHGVEADAVILDQVDRLPDSSPVVVATDDRRVRREAAARGANVITQEQLFFLL